ncbi:MAG: LysR substrate-binding domain-containing protein [Boseongicola sp.]
MRYSQLRAFHNVAFHGGFSRAAEALNQSQPSLSDQVRNLEQSHDVLLFYRDARQVRLTGAGEELFILTRQFFEIEAEIGDYLDRSRAEIAGTLRIIADSALHVTGFVSRYRAAHPNVFVSVHTGNTEEVLHGLRSYEAEIGVVANLVPAADLDSVELGSASIVAVAADGYIKKKIKTLSLEELKRYPLIFREVGSRTRRALEEAAAKRGIRFDPVIEVEGREAMREIVASGAGIGFISEAELGSDPRVRALPIDGLQLKMSETLVTLKARRDVRVVRSFLRTLGKPEAQLPN